MGPPNGWVPSGVTKASSSCPAVTAAGMATLWLLLAAAKLVSATSSTSGNCASARGVAWQPSHVAPPSVVIVTIISTPAGASAGLSPPGHFAPDGQDCGRPPRRDRVCQEV